MSIMAAMIRLLLPLLILIAAPVHAQAPETAAETPPPEKVINQYDQKYKVKPVIIQSGRGDIIPQNKFGVYFVRASHNPAEATLRLSSPLSVNGCIVVHQPPPDIRYEPPYLRVFLEHPSIQLDKE